MENQMDDRRREAVERLKQKRDFRTHLSVYVVVNALLVAIWALSGAGYFWPVWTLLGWGVGIVFHWWDTYMQKPITEQQIEREMGRGDR
ncbi:MAG: 2TM domain-containing protein [Acidimicrobiia bacterium]|nr:2TM domain-containing protein [Acidimicrobiia bacterium]